MQRCGPHEAAGHSHDKKETDVSNPKRVVLAGPVGREDSLRVGWTHEDKVAGAARDQRLGGK
ncbi:MAG: hypothetical protein JWM93_2012 [Frankiales bacterium]|nr:hypothetical protein [Frankiales bacterium]